MGVGKNLHPQAIEKPRRVGGNVRRLVSPVVKVVVAEQADVRQENARIDIDPIQGVDVVAAVGLCQITVRSVQIPLALGRTGIVAWRGCRIHAELSHQASANIVPVEVAAHAQLLQLDFVRAENFARSTD